MSKIKLPKISALQQDENWLMRDGAIGLYNSAIKAADDKENADDATTISILDVIGEDWWTGEGVTSKRIAAALRKIGNQDVTVNLNSPGGDFFEGVAIYNMLSEHSGAVTVKIMGLAASAASVIAMAGDEILIAKTGFMMVHNAWAIAIGNRHDFVDASKRLEPFDQAMADLYGERSGKGSAAAAEWMDAEKYFNGKEAIDAGLATDVLPSDQIDAGGDAGESAQALRASLRLENALKAQSPDLSRSERRALLSDHKGGKPGAVAAVKPSADFSELAAKLDGLNSTIQAT